MTDNEIIKALEYCISDNNNICTGCAALKNGIDCALEYSIIYDLIKRQQAEIDRLNIDLKAMRGAANSYKAHYEDLKSENLETIKILKTAKSEAVREFVEKLKEKLKANSNYGDIYDVVAYDCVDKLMEEMGCNDD